MTCFAGPLELQGWNPAEQLYTRLAETVNAQFIIEVGTWKGMSASYLASYLKSRRSGVLLCVDTWLGTLTSWTRRGTSKKFNPSLNLHLKHGYPSVYFSFLSNMVHLNLTEYVVPFPVPSRIAAQFLAEEPRYKADLIHIDAAHEYQDVVSAGQNRNM
jgi:hypothetical protein